MPEPIQLRQPAPFPLEKLPPSSVDAEQAVIGSLLIDRDAITIVSEFLQPSDFFRDSHRLLYEAILYLYENNQPSDIVTVTDRLEQLEQLPQVSGVAYVHSLVTVVPTAVHVEHYAKIVKRTALRRSLISFGGMVAGVGYDESVPVDAALEQVAEMLQAIASTRLSRHAGVFSINDITHSIHELYESGANRGVSTGYTRLDEYYRPVLGDWTLAIGWPSHGKSTLLDNFAYNLMASEGWKFGICSPENQPLARHAAKLLEIHTGKPFTKGYVDRMSWQEVIEGEAWLNERVHFILPAEGQRSIAGLLAVMSAAIDEHELTGIIIDPWNELEHDAQGNARDDTYISRSLTSIRSFVRQRQIHLWLAAHPHSMPPNKDTGALPVVTPRDINGGQMWWNKGDNIISVYRDDDDATQVHIQKIRNEGMNGDKGNVTFAYDKVSKRFYEPGHAPAHRLNQRSMRPGDGAKLEDDERGGTK